MVPAGRRANTEPSSCFLHCMHTGRKVDLLQTMWMRRGAEFTLWSYYFTGIQGLNSSTLDSASVHRLLPLQPNAPAGKAPPPLSALGTESISSIPANSHDAPLLCLSMHMTAIRATTCTEMKLSPDKTRLRVNPNVRKTGLSMKYKRYLELRVEIINGTQMLSFFAVIASHYCPSYTTTTTTSISSSSQSSPSLWFMQHFPSSPKTLKALKVIMTAKKKRFKSQKLRLIASNPRVSHWRQPDCDTSIKKFFIAIQMSPNWLKLHFLAF